jgi:hypothetical protein
MAASSIDVAAVAACCNGRSLMPAKAYLALMRKANTGNELAEPPLAKERRQLQGDTRRTRSVESLSAELEAMRAQANTVQERADVQQQSIDLAAKELAEVSVRLQAAADAVRQSI